MKIVLTKVSGVVILSKLERESVDDRRGISVMGIGPKQRWYFADITCVYVCVSELTYFQCNKW